MASGCGANLSTVLNVQNAPVVLPAGQAPSPQATRDAIMRAIAAKHWQIEGEAPTTIVTGVSSGGHSASVRIDYNANYYSINYLKSSESLKYDGQHIHRRYNHWVERLREAIDREIAQTGYVPVVPGTMPPPAAAPAPGPVAPPPAPATEPAPPPPPPPG